MMGPKCEREGIGQYVDGHRTDRHHTALPFIGGVVLAVWPPCRDTVRTPEFVHLSRGKKELEHTCVGGKITVDTPSRARCKMLSMRRSMMTTLAMRSRPTRRQSSLPVGRTRRARLLLIWRVNECEWIGADVGCLSWQRGGCVFGVTAARGDVCTRCMLHPRRLHQAPFEAQARRCFYGRHDAVLLRSGRSCT